MESSWMIMMILTLRLSEAGDDEYDNDYYDDDDYDDFDDFDDYDDFDDFDDDDDSQVV